jgi:hypothetical protein
VTDGILHPIASIAPQTGFRLRVTWASGEQSTVDFTDDIGRGGVWAALRDEAAFARARVAYHGHVLEWPEPAGPRGEPRIDIDADGLFEMAARQQAEERSKRLVPAGRDEDHAA